jgi:hypothetical protein
LPLNTKLERGRVAMYSTPSSYGLVFSWKGRNHTVEQEAPFDADEVVTKASEWADKLENIGLPSSLTELAHVAERHRRTGGLLGFASHDLSPANCSKNG